MRPAKSRAIHEGHLWEKRIENALMLGDFISWREMSDFRDELGRLLAELASFAALVHDPLVVPL